MVLQLKGYELATKFDRQSIVRDAAATGYRKGPPKADNFRRKALNADCRTQVY